MTQPSEAAWNIARLYAASLASETRDLAAHIDVAIAAERERCAKIAETVGADLGFPGNKLAAGIEMAGSAIAVAIRTDTA